MNSPKDPRKKLGHFGESLAAQLLQEKGYEIIEQNWRSAHGEIDLIAKAGQEWVFVEVKTRTTTDAGHPVDAIDATKQRRMTQAALAYLKSHGLLEHAARFDAVAVTWPDNVRRPTIEHFKNAFSPVGAGQFFS